jgi:hypothetical protein
LAEMAVIRMILLSPWTEYGLITIPSIRYGTSKVENVIIRYDDYSEEFPYHRWSLVVMNSSFKIKKLLSDVYSIRDHLADIQKIADKALISAGYMLINNEQDWQKAQLLQ